MPDIPGLGSVEGILKGVAGNENIKTIAIWGVLMQLLSPILAPLSQEITNLIQSEFQFVPLGVPDLADMVERGHISLEEATGMAKMSGINPANFELLVKNVGAPPGPAQLLMAYRRGYIPEGGTGAESISLQQGIRESRVMDKWIPVIQKLGLQPISASEAVNAWVRGQIPEGQAKQLIYENGLDAAMAQILYDTTGNPPSITELMNLYRRGLIAMHGTGPGVLSVDQGIREGSSKDKWIPAYEQLSVYLPPPRTVTTLEKAGVISASEAQTLYTQHGLTPQIAAAYSKDAFTTKTVKQKQLAESMVLDLYETKAISQPQADTYLGDLGYDAQEAHYIESVYDLKRELGMLTSAISRIRTLYISRKIDRSSAVDSLGQLAVPADSVTYYLTVWDLERVNTVRLLTESQIVDAFKYGVYTQAEAQTELVAIGYTPHDAWVVLSVGLHAPQPDEPPVGASPSGNIT